MTDLPHLSPERQHRRRGVAAILLLAAGGALAAAVYGIGTQWRNAPEAACRPAVELAQRIAPLVRGEVAALALAERPLRLPNLTFNDETGRAHTLADWRGRFVLFNLWATWCIPCRKEMPALDALEAKLGGQDFEVVAVNIDTRDANKPRAWLRDVGITRLAYYADPSAKAFQDLKLIGRAFGMPTTLLIDPAGCEVGTVAGPAEWVSEDALKLLGSALGRPS
jgi:thiol-disulfide isomerase/thioredoxin